MRCHWYAIQVDMDASLSLRPDYISEGIYYYSLLAKHVSDKKLSDEYSRWWPDWYRYSRNSVTNAILFSDRVIFHP